MTDAIATPELYRRVSIPRSFTTAGTVDGERYRFGERRCFATTSGTNTSPCTPAPLDEGAYDGYRSTPKRYTAHILD